MKTHLTLLRQTSHCLDVFSRVTDPNQAPTTVALSALGTVNLPVIQFSKPTYSKPLLKSINALCKVFGKKLPIRFYGHYATGFDASVLQYLPDVQWLLIDCLQEIENPEFIFKLSKLKKLSFGVYNYKNSDFLNRLNLEQVELLSISKTKGRGFDLSNLKRATKLRDLTILGHTKGIHSIGVLKNIDVLNLWSIGKNTSLEFVCGMSNLRCLKVALGGRENFDEISLPRLTDLEVIRIRGLSDLGDLSRFPELRYLHIEDQLQLKTLKVNTPKLEVLKILNCKTLSQIECLEDLEVIKHLRCFKTSLDYDHLCEFNWPASMKCFGLYTGSIRRDELMRERLDSKGYKEF